MARHRRFLLEKPTMRSYAKRQRGVTLIELLIVVTILAFASAVVIVKAPPSRSAVRTDAERFAVKLTAALDLGLMTGRSFRLEVEENQYYFAHFHDGEWARGDLPSLLQVVDLSKGTVVEVEAQDHSLKNHEGITGGRLEKKELITLPLDAIGVSNNFKVTFSRQGQVWVVSLDESGTLEVSRAKR